MSSAQSASVLDLAGLTAMLRRRWPIVVVSTISAVAMALGVSAVQPHRYEAVARVLVQPRGTETLFSESSRSDIEPQVVMETEIQVLKSEPVRQRVIDEIGSVRRVGAQQVGETLVLEVKGVSGDPERAAVVASTYARTYIEFRREQAVGDLARAEAELGRRVAEAEAEIAALDRQLAAAPPDVRSDVQERLGPRLAAQVQQQASMRSRLDEVRVQAQLTSGGAQLVAPALVPEKPFQPAPVRNGILALILGLVSGTALAAVVHHLDDRVRARREVEQALGGLPVLGEIPLVDGWEGQRAHGHFHELGERGSPVAEAYRSLRTSIQLASLDTPIKVVQCSSPHAGDGKTTTVANLGIVLGVSEQRVLLIDADLRRGRLHEALQLPNHAGLTTVVAGRVTLADAVHRVAGTRLDVLTSGPTPPNPSELLASARLRNILEEAREQYDVIIVDSPPVLPVTDAMVIARWVDATVVVAAANSTRRTDLLEAIETLRLANAPLLGVVLNRSTERVTYGYYTDSEGRRARGADDVVISTKDVRNVDVRETNGPSLSWVPPVSSPPPPAAPTRVGPDDDPDAPVWSPAGSAGTPSPPGR